VAYASQQGYPTLAIDRLGNGDSDHPDPLLVVQMPAHAEIAHRVIQLAKAGIRMPWMQLSSRAGVTILSWQESL
jgi:hypothetical protein